MRTRQIDYEDDDDDRVVRDGGSVRVPMTFMDHKLHDDLVSRYPPRHSVTDAFGAPAGHRPGYVFSTDDAARNACNAAWEEQGRILQNAWRNPPNTHHGDRRTSSDAHVSSRKADAKSAWEERGRLMREAWRHP